ncbi:globin [Rubritalea sp.]|uniref:globin domain-containing protein n=1 Tax=Rubritalea sp. TaxID=2109375 RepID=UPI003EF665BC
MNENFIMEDVGREGIERMVKLFYKQVPEDSILGSMYPKNDLVGAEERLSDFLLYRLAGDETYTQKRGHPRLRARHMPFQIGIRERDRWVALMDTAMDEAELSEEAKTMLHDFFLQIADFMRNVPEGGGINFRPQ